MNEFELKFEIPVQSLPKITAAVHAKKAQLQTLQACYFDTKDGALAKHGLVLRLRKEGNDWVQTAKGLTSDSLERLEHNVKIGSPQSNLIKSKAPSAKAASNKQSSPMPDIDLSRHADEKIGRLIIDALNIKHSGLYPALIPMYETDVQRLKFTVKHAGSIIEIALDQGMVLSGARSAALCELEIELKQGKPEHVVDLARTWCATYGLWLNTISKSMKGQRLQRQLLFGQLSDENNQLRPNANSQQLVKAVFKSCLNQILANASEIGYGSQHADHIHQLRVGIRRLRTAMHELNVLVDSIDPAWEVPLIHAFRILGQYRDNEHLIRELQPQIATKGGPNIKNHYKDANISDSNALDISSMIRSKDFQSALLSLIGYTHSNYLSHSDSSVIVNTTDIETYEGSAKYKHKKVKKILAKRFDHLNAQIVKEGKKFSTLNVTQQHSVRKHFKRLRYLAEFSNPLFSSSPTIKKRVSIFIAALKPVQDALGLYNDELTALQAYRKLAVNDQRAWFGAGWLSARRKSNAKKCQQKIDVFIKKTNKNKLFWQ